MFTLNKDDAVVGQVIGSGPVDLEPCKGDEIVLQSAP